MSGWLYLIRNQDLYKIGITKNFDKRMRQLKPDNVVAKLYTRDYLKLERELHIRYKKVRIPQTEYFRLEDSHVNEINQILSKIDLSKSVLIGIFIQSLLFIILIFCLIFIFISLNVNDFDIILSKSFGLMDRILFGYSFLSLFLNSRKHLCFLSELKFRLSRSIVFILFAFFFRIIPIFLQ